MRKTIMVLVAVLLLTLALVPIAVADVDLPVYAEVYSDSMQLDNKNTSTWATTPGDDIGGTLYYDDAGPTFDFALEAEGLPNGDYSLIYYADTEDRFSDWGGLLTPGVGQVIHSFTVNADPFDTSGSTDLGIDLPMLPDANAYFYNYTEAPDIYDHATGAKVWVVPTGVLTGGDMPVATWSPDDTWLFETDLIEYDDTDVEPPDLIGISVDPTEVDFGNVVAGDSATESVLVTNIGYVSVDVDVTVPGAGLFSNITHDWVTAPGAVSTLTSHDDTDTCDLTLNVPAGYASGPETGSVTFTVSPTTP